MKRVISLLMSVVMLLSFAMGMNLTVFADDGKTIKSATLTPAKTYTLYEGNYAGCSEGTDAQGNPYKEYFYLTSNFNVGDVVDITFSDGTTKKYKYHSGATETQDWVEGWLNTDDENERIYLYSHEFTIDTADGLGTAYASYGIMDSDYNDYNYEIKNVPVEIIKNPIDTFSFTPINGSCTVTEGNYSGGSVDYDADGNPYEVHYYQVKFNEGDKITVKYTDGSSGEFVYQKGEIWDFVNDKNEVLNVYSCQFRDNGLSETTFEVELTDYGKTINVPVTVVAKSSGGSTSGGSTSGGSTGGGSVAPAPTTDDSKKIEEQKPATSTTTTTTTATETQKPATVKVSKTKAKQKAVVVTWNTVENVTGYQVQLATDKKFKKNKKTVTVAKQNASKKTVKKLKSKKKYYVRVRSYKIVNGKKVYGKWSKIKSFKTK